VGHVRSDFNFNDTDRIVISRCAFEDWIDALIPCPSVANPKICNNDSETVGKIGALIHRCIDDGNPVMLGGSFDRQPEFGRPPIRLALIDERDQFGSCLRGSI
jgi:hypothetical protein